jgi:hypothetical protein
LNEVLELLEEEGQKEKEENTAKEIRKRALDNCTPKKGITLDIPALEFNWMCILNCACNHGIFSIGIQKFIGTCF